MFNPPCPCASTMYLVKFSHALVLSAGVGGRRSDDQFQGLGFNDTQLADIHACYTQCRIGIAPTVGPILAGCLGTKSDVDLAAWSCLCSDSTFVTTSKSCDIKCFPSDRMSDLPASEDIEQTCAGYAIVPGEPLYDGVPVRLSIYHYRPTPWICGLFVTLFALATIIHLALGIRHRLWWILAATVLCGTGETIGWGARLWSAYTLFNRTPFMMHLSPTFLVAANFIILGRIITLVGLQYSRLKPRAYAYIFLTADAIALVVQAVGGGQAAAAITLPAANRGANVMLGGIVFQFVAIILYVGLAMEFFVRYWLDKPIRTQNAATRLVKLDRKLQMMSFGLAFDTLFILIRTVYRTIELAMDALDGMPIVVAMYTLIVFHLAA
ncbi:RTA1 like protein-domain-containing protein [Auriculariales sp. MPI-PUGE-AT-0066]|nr:RTA1 like protein-domain-containing protein [Auriculariales sp. MPI-PUGE-AT-0066]